MKFNPQSGDLPRRPVGTIPAAMAKAKKLEGEKTEMAVGDLAVLIRDNDKSLRALIANLGAKIEERSDEIVAVMARNFERVEGNLEEFRRETENRFQRIDDRFQSVEMKILGVNNRIDILIDRTPSREEFRRLEGRVAVLESRRKR